MAQKIKTRELERWGVLFEVLVYTGEQSNLLRDTAGDRLQLPNLENGLNYSRCDSVVTYMQHGNRQGFEQAVGAGVAISPNHNGHST